MKSDKNFIQKIAQSLCIIIVLLTGCKELEISSIANVDTFEISSTNTSSQYLIQVLYPDDFDSTSTYQTIYLLDGDWYFNELGKIVSERYSEDAVLIAIGYESSNNRTTDLTFPSHSRLKDSGGGLNFLSFINKELIPYVQNNLKIKSNDLTLAGHSLGGFFSLFVLLQQEQVNPFNNFISISPSLFWSDSYLLYLEDQFANDNVNLDKKLFIAMGDLEGVAMNTHFNAIVHKLEGRSYPGLLFESERLNNSSHNNGTLEGFKKGLSLVIK